MTFPDRSDLVRQRARRAYERDMLGHGLRSALLGAVLIPVALALHGPASTRITLLVAAVLVAVLVATGWRGGGWRRGAVAGVIAGLPPFIVPSLIMPRAVPCVDGTCGHAAATMPWLSCFAMCSLAAVATGVLLAILARRDRATSSYWASAVVTAGLTASMTCAVAGAAGVLGAVVGLAAGSTPFVVLRLWRAPA